MSRARERIYIAVTTLALATTAFLGVLLWDERRGEERVILSVGEDGLSLSAGEER